MSPMLNFNEAIGYCHMSWCLIAHLTTKGIYAVILCYQLVPNTRVNWYCICVIGKAV